MEYKVNNLLYAAGPDMRNTIRTDVTLTEPVNVQALEKAVQTAAVRFPYYAVKLVRNGSEYRMVDNQLPFVISPNGKTVTLGTEESNDHLVAFAYDGCSLYVDSCHFITDGNSAFPFLKTILYYYLSTLHPDETFDTKTIALAGSKVPEAEMEDDPYPDELLPEFPLGVMARPAGVFTLSGQPQGYEHMKEWTSFAFRISQHDLMTYVSSVDGSPVSFIAALMYQAISQCHPENHLPVVCGVQHQFRKALHKPFSHLCHVKIVPVIYPDSMKDRDMEWLNTVTRGKLIIGADEANDVLTINEHIRNEKQIRNMPLSQKHVHMRKAVLDGIGTNTFEVSYTGRVLWSGLDKYITNLIPYLDLTLSGGLTIEIFSVHDIFSVNIMQRSADRRYVDRFAELLEKSHLAFTEEASVHFELCGFKLPE